MASLHLHVVKMYTRPKMFKLYSDPCVNMRYMVAQYSTQAQACLGYIRKLIADDNNHKVFHHVDMYITHIVTLYRLVRKTLYIFVYYFQPYIHCETIS